MNCRAAVITSTQQAPSARERLEAINDLAIALFDRIQAGSTNVELRLRALEIQHIAVIGAAYERRRERGETPSTSNVEKFDAR